MAQQEQDSYYVLNFMHEGVGWTSLHRTREGAQQKLQQKVDEWGLWEAYSADELAYGISYLPVED